MTMRWLLLMALTLSHFRFGINELLEATHGWHAAEDTSPASGVIALDTTFLLRFCVQANATGLSNVDNEFQYRRNGGTWTNITTTSTFVRAVASVLVNGANTTKRLSGTGTFESSSAGVTTDGTSGGTANDIVASGNSETECSLQLRSADVVGGDVLDFRLTRDGGILLDTYAVVPSLTIPLSPISGTASITLGSLTLSATGVVAAVGSASITLGALTLAAEGSGPAPPISGEAAITLGTLTSAATGTVPVVGTSSTVLGAVVAAAAGEVAITGAAANALGALTVSATGTVGGGGGGGTVAVRDLNGDWRFFWGA